MIRIKIILSALLLGGLLCGAGAETHAPLRLSFTGDLMAHSINYRMGDYDKIYSGLEGLLLEDDLTFGNVEFPMDPEKPMASFPNFNIHTSYVEAFIRAGLDVFSIANNHTADIGDESLIATILSARRLCLSSDRPLYFSGASEPAPELPPLPPKPDEPPVIQDHFPAPPVLEEREPLREFPITGIEHRGWKIGFLALTQKSNVKPEKKGVLNVVNYENSEDREELLKQIRISSAQYDLFILSYHGGVEYSFLPDPGKKQFFMDLIRSGVDIVYSHHPHVLQEMELVKTPGGTKAILYSMGNFLSGQGRIIDEALPEEEWSYTGDSAIVQLIVGRTDRGEATVMHIHPIGLANYITPNREVLLYPFETLATMPLPSPWDEFYRERRRLMEGFFRENVHSSVR